MKFIIKNYFEKQFKKIVSDFDIKKLTSKISIKSKNFIKLKEPFVKIKIKSKNKTYRLLISYKNDSLIILFINIFDKKDKKIWENLNWNLHNKQIKYWTQKNIECIKNWKYYNIFN